MSTVVPVDLTTITSEVLAEQLLVATTPDLQATVVSGSVFSDEGDGVWKARIAIAGIDAYLSALLNTRVLVTLGTTVYVLYVDSRSLSMTGPATIATELSLVSAGAFLSAPRAAKRAITIPLDTTASALVAEMAGPVGVDWEITDWFLPARVQEWQAATPMEVIREIAEATGAVVDARPDGRLVVRYKFPVSSAAYSTSTPTAILQSAEDALTINEEHNVQALYGTFRILDKAADSGDRLEYEADEEDPDKLRGWIHAYPRPYRTNIEVIHTSDADIVLGAGVWTSRTEVEQIEVVAWNASTRYPIESLVDVDWMDTPAGTLTFTKYDTELSVSGVSGDGYGLISLTYTTLSLVCPVSSSKTDAAQFLIKEV